jgi:hypothetical protein
MVILGMVYGIGFIYQITHELFSGLPGALSA